LNKNLAGGCGLYCGICEIYRAYKDSKELREELAKDIIVNPKRLDAKDVKQSTFMDGNMIMNGE
jgi:hypothetical protein